MPVKKLKIIVDTNLWISFLISKKLDALDNLFAIDNLVLIFSEELLEEFIEVAKRPKFEKYFSITDLVILLSQIYNKAQFINVKSEISICRDEKDNFLLSLAKDSKANYLISGDKDLLEIQKLGNTNIVTISEFLSLHK